jgi:GNAT superfamily N-acetyltransferase
VIAIRNLTQADIPECAAILRSLPDWFGIEESTAQYVRDLETLPAFVATVDGDLVGFLALIHHTDVGSEIHVLAVSPDRHRTGIGRALVDCAESVARGRSAKLLQVKTLGPSNPDPNYARTRAFYLALGFLPLEETNAFWGEDNPALVLVKPLTLRP